MNTTRMLAISVMTLGLSFATHRSRKSSPTFRLTSRTRACPVLFGSNSFGQIVGLSRDGDGTPNGTCFVHGVLWNRNGDFTTLDVHNSPTGLRSMNSSGDFTGIYLDDALARVHGFLLRNGVVTNIDFPNSIGIDNVFINDLGLIVAAFIDVARVEHGFIATCSGNGC